LITIAMVALVFGLFMLLLRDSFVISRRMSSKDEARRAAQVGLDRVLTEGREAYQWVSLAASPATSTQFEMLKVTAPDPVRFPAAPPGYPVPQASLLPWLALGPWVLLSATFDPQQAVHSQRVRYTLQNQSLVREVGPPSGPLANPMALANGLSGFNCWSEPGQLLVVVLTYPEGRRVQRLVGKVVCPAVERN
jgi:hypothetical protein